MLDTPNVGAIQARWAAPVLPPLDVVVPRSLPELLELVSRGRRVFSGGTDLLVGASHAGTDPGTLVWAGSVPELRTLHEQEAGSILVGAATPLGRVAASRAVRAAAPAVADAADLVGSVQIRNVATLAGNLCNASPAADTVPAMCVHDTIVHVARVDGTTRTVPVQAIPVGPGTTTLSPGEVVTGLSIRPLGPDEGSSYLRFTERNSMDLAFAGVGVRVSVDSDRIVRSAAIALGAVAPAVLIADEAASGVVGRPASEETFLVAGRAAAAAASPISDLRASAGYRRRLVEVLVVDAFIRACRRAVERRTGGVIPV